jgi:hypothetical protein
MHPMSDDFVGISTQTRQNFQQVFIGPLFFFSFLQGLGTWDTNLIFCPTRYKIMEQKYNLMGSAHDHLSYFKLSC